MVTGAGSEDEAADLADRTELAGGRAAVHRRPDRAALDAIVRDSAVASVTVLGTGSLSGLALDTGEEYDWTDVARAADHLKRGWCTQLHGSDLARPLNVPLGLFMLEDPERLIAGAGTAVMTGHPLAYETFLAGHGDFGRPVAAGGFDADLTRTFRRRLVQLSDAFAGRGDPEAAALLRVCEERLGLDAPGFLTRHGAVIREAIAGSEPALREVYAHLAAACPNARFFLRP